MLVDLTIEDLERSLLGDAGMIGVPRKLLATVLSQARAAEGLRAEVADARAAAEMWKAMAEEHGRVCNTAESQLALCREALEKLLETLDGSGGHTYASPNPGCYECQALYEAKRSLSTLSSTAEGK